MSKLAIGYARVSTFKQASEGISLEAQEQAIEKWCNYHGFELMGIYTDAGISGKSMKNRPRLQAALKAIKKDMALVTYSFSRIARNTLELLQIGQIIDNQKANLASISEDIDTTKPHGKFFFTLIAAMNELERTQTGERTRLVKEYYKSQGRFNGGSIPYGYRLVVEPSQENPLKPKKILMEAPQEMEVLTFARSLRKEGFSLPKIKNALDKKGCRNRNGNLFDVRQISRFVDLA